MLYYFTNRFESRTKKLKEDNEAKLNKCLQEKENLTAMVSNITRDIEVCCYQLFNYKYLFYYTFILFVLWQMTTNTKHEIQVQFNELRQQRVAAKQMQRKY